MVMYKEGWLETWPSCALNLSKLRILYFSTLQLVMETTSNRFSLFCYLKSYVAGMAASGALTSVLRLITKAAFKNVENGLRKGACKYTILFLFLLSTKSHTYIYSESALYMFITRV